MPPVNSNKASLSFSVQFTFSLSKLYTLHKSRAAVYQSFEFTFLFNVLVASKETRD